MIAKQFLVILLDEVVEAAATRIGWSTHIRYLPFLLC